MDEVETKETSEVRELYRAQCYCGWKGPPRKSIKDALELAKDHSELTGHSPPSD